MNLIDNKNQKVFIAGSGGMVGSAIKRAYLNDKKYNVFVELLIYENHGI